MERNFKDAMMHRRSYYNISDESTISDSKIYEIIESAVKHVPSAFNSQTTRTVLLLGDNHTKLWDIVKNILKERNSADSYAVTEEKINKSFASGYGTILFFENMDIVYNLQSRFPLYSENFPLWSQQTSGMHQFAIWTMLEDEGMGASLQHYNPLIDEEVAKAWNINPKWKLISQMPFGKPLIEPFEKEFAPLDERILVFK